MTNKEKAEMILSIVNEDYVCMSENAPQRVLFAIRDLLDSIFECEHYWSRIGEFMNIDIAQNGLLQCLKCKQIKVS